MYQKGGGKNGKHAAVNTADNIAALSRIGVQVYSCAFSTQFTIHSNPTFNTKAFRIIPSHAFLVITPSIPTSAVRNTTIIITKTAHTMFKDLCSHHKGLSAAMKELRKRTKEGNDGADSN
jgi:hypothetical protein